MSRFISENYASLAPYTPGEQPRDMQYIKLNTNENPFPPSPRVVSALSSKEISRLNIYSDPDARDLTSAIAEKYGVRPSQVIVGNGSDELLAFFFLAFCSDSRPAYCPRISYGFYPVFAQFARVPYVPVPMGEGLSVDVNDYIGCGGCVIIANPNAPTGRTLPLPDIERLLAGNPDTPVLIDEAYVDFGAQSALPLLDKYDNLVVVRTLSKSRCLAGGRLGFAIGRKDVIADMQALRFSFNPYNVNRLTLLAGQAALADEEYFLSCRDTVMSNRERAAEELLGLGFEVLPSSANFVFARTGAMSGQKLYLELKKHGILIRHFDDPLITDWLRITIGSREQMDALFARLRDILA